MRSPPGGVERGDELVERVGNLGGVAAEADADDPVADGDLFVGDDGDAAEGLGVEEHEAAGDTVDKLEGFVVE